MLPKVREWHDVDLATFDNAILPENKPAVLRGLMRDWPAVQEGLKSARALCDYIAKCDSGRPVETLVGDAAIRGRFFYSDDLTGLNFTRRSESISSTLETLLKHIDDPSPPAIFIQSASIPEYLPNFLNENAIDLANRSAIPRIWVGNSITVTTHYDISDNIACVVGGHRRFTFFPRIKFAICMWGQFISRSQASPLAWSPWKIRISVDIRVSSRRWPLHKSLTFNPGTPSTSRISGGITLSPWTDSTFSSITGGTPRHPNSVHHMIAYYMAF